MQTNLPDDLRRTALGREAESILRSCVHCGFCTATCPTYLLLGDERDSPRGRIYLVKQALEGAELTARTQLHLDRCLTCRACETACPSGVAYGHLIDIGRAVVEERVPRSVAARVGRALLRTGLTGPFFGPLYRLGQSFRALLPRSLRAKVLVRRAPGAWPTAAHARQVILPAGCVQRSMAPGIDRAAARVLDRIGIEVVRPAVAGGCCGALPQHLGAPAAALEDARRNIDAWWPLVEAGVEAIVSTASGCGVMVKDYGHLLREDPHYAKKAARVSALTRDVSEVIRAHVKDLAAVLPARASERLVVHAPCTLQHGQRLPGVVEGILRSLGVEVRVAADAHLCCGSAGTYSVLQSALSNQLRERKLAALEAARGEVIVSANIGCIAHLAGGTSTPVRHWIEWLDARLA